MSEDAPEPISIGGTRIDPGVVSTIERRMGEGPFTMADIVALARQCLGAVGGPVSVCHQLAERAVRRAVRNGLIHHHGRKAGAKVVWQPGGGRPDRG